MLARKKKATFYLPEDLLRVARVHAARTDRRDSQVVEEALRAYLGYGNEESPWTSDADPPARSADERPAHGGAEVEVPVPSERDEPPPPLDPDEALALAVAELHALRDEDAGGR